MSIGAKVVPMRGVEMLQIPRAQFEVQVRQLQMRVLELESEINGMRDEAEASRMMANRTDGQAHGINVGSWSTASKHADRIANRARTTKISVQNVARWLEPRDDV